MNDNDDDNDNHDDNVVHLNVVSKWQRKTIIIKYG